jgi:hypothetical protein
MEKIFTLFFILAMTASYAQINIYRCAKPVTINDGTYNVSITTQTIDTINNGTTYLLVTLNRICTRAQEYKGFEKLGGYQIIKRVYSFDAGDQNSAAHFVADLSYDGGNILDKHIYCLLAYTKDGVKVRLSNSVGGDNLEFSCKKKSDEPSALTANDLVKDRYIDEDYLNYISSTASISNGSAFVPYASSNLNVNFVPQFGGNIDDDAAFPAKGDLYNYLKNNYDFVFKMTIDLYLDIIKYRSCSNCFDKEVVDNFLHTHDLWYLRYANNPQVLNRKINACYKLLQEASGKINLGDIYYKDYGIDLNQMNLSANPFLWTAFDNKDDYYTTKLLKGSSDAYYQKNALSLYLSNWISFNNLRADSSAFGILTRMKALGEKVTLRVYFLLQPSSAYNTDGTFKGITAYGLRSILYKNCPSHIILNVENNTIDNIKNTEAKRCYAKAAKYVDEIVHHPEQFNGLNTSVLYENNFTQLGSWRYTYKECEQAFNYLSGQVVKGAGDERTICFRIMTNYNCTFKPGYEIKFTNRLSNASFRLPIAEVAVTQTSNDQGYFKLVIKTNEATIKKMLSEKINAIEFQSADLPGKTIADKIFYYNPNRVVNSTPVSLKIPFKLGKHNDCEKLSSFLAQEL